MIIDLYNLFRKLNYIQNLMSLDYLYYLSNNLSHKLILMYIINKFHLIHSKELVCETELKI